MMLYCSIYKSCLPANLSCGEDESVTQLIISVDLGVVECLLKTSNQELGW